jgi:hypothetical protein
MDYQTLTLFSISAGNVQRKLQFVADHRLTCVRHGGFDQHILSQVLANCDSSKTRCQLSDITCFAKNQVRGVTQIMLKSSITAASATQSSESTSND